MTIYGQGDAAYTTVSNSAEKRSGIWGAGRGSNFLGFMGTEDLGGGWKANFKLEAQYNLDNGTGVATNLNNQVSGAPGIANVANSLTPATATTTFNRSSSGTATPMNNVAGAQGLTFNRWSYVGASNNGVGEIRIGREYTPALQAILAADVVGANGIGNSLNMTLALAGNNSAATPASASNGVSYQTPNTLGGFGVKAQYFFGENKNNGTAANANPPKAGDGNSYHLFYANGPLSAGHAAQTTKGTAVARGATDSGIYGKYEQSTMYGKYDMGVAVLTAAQVTEKLGGIGSASTGAYKNVSNVLGASVPVSGTALRVNVNYITSTYSKDGADVAKGTQLALQGLYSLSKRTDLYATYAKTDNKAGVSATPNYYTFGSGSGAIVNPAASTTGYQIGMRHNF